ncbi:MAG: hypothetical protein U0791_06325 [Gemmataceae bacterium]
MPRSRKSIPTPREHKGAAVVDFYDAGKRRTITLGPWNSTEAQDEYDRLLARIRAANRNTPAPDCTVNEMMLA